ncbi:ATG18A [Symbiodinium pilosum]|uniref:ATG18A protein n=1 Tax=Symbiodinium pilosum TaxID=2952 RepID=A0A812YGR4_SYMPI|nr:ATG18A [Symbiodinium pilosum]
MWQNDFWIKDDFVQKFGSRRVKTNNGHFDHLRSKEVLTLEQYLKQNVSEWNLFFADMAYSLQRDVWDSLGAAVEPPPLHGFDARPILSIGTQASSTRAHSHAETWQLLLAGLKAWWLAKPGQSSVAQLQSLCGSPTALL